MYSKTIIVFQGYMANLAFARQGMGSGRNAPPIQEKVRSGESLSSLYPLNTPGLHYLPISQQCTPSRASLGTNFSAFILSSLEQHTRGQGPVPQPSEQQHTKLILVREKGRWRRKKKKEIRNRLQSEKY